MQKNRDLSFDAFRGLAIIAVVAIHAITTGFSCRYRPTGQWDFILLVSCRQLLNFAVPAFLFISGYWTSKKPIRSFHDYKIFLKRRLPRVLVPYLFWSLIFIAGGVIKTHHIDVSQTIFKLLTGRVPIHYFFIILIAQLYVITPLLQYINRRPCGWMLVLILNTVGLLVLYLSRLYNIIWHLPAALPFYSWIIFYEIGLLMGNRNNKIFASKNVRLFIVPAMLAFLLISELEAMIVLLKYNNLGFAISATKYSSFLYSLSVIFAFLLVRKTIKHWPKFLIALGNYSFGIYLIHMFILARIAGVVQKTNIIYSFQPLYQFIVVLVTVLISFALISITRKLLPKSFCSKVLGF